MLRSVYEMIAEMRLTLKLWLVDVFTYDSFWLKIFDRVTLARCDWLKMKMRMTSPQVYEMFLYWWHCQLPPIHCGTQLYSLRKNTNRFLSFILSPSFFRFRLLTLLVLLFVLCFVSLLERAAACNACKCSE